MSFIEVTQSLFTGFGTTLLIFFVSLVLSVPLGIPIALCSLSKYKPISYISRGFVWIIRGTPLMLQIIVVFYGPGLWFNYPMKSRLTAVIVAFVINYACYFSEIYRGGILSIPKGQYEACQVLGINKYQTFLKVILPQVIKKIVPAMGNEVITLVKDTSLARVIAVTDLIMAAQEIVRVKAILWPLFYTGAFYLLFSARLVFIFGKLEKKLDYYKV